jgi:predicted DNA-binding transcriptional regulator AlpA
MSANAPQQQRLLTAREVADHLGVHVRSVWRLASTGRLPQPVRLSKRIVRWRQSDVAKAIEQAQG